MPEAQEEAIAPADPPKPKIERKKVEVPDEPSADDQDSLELIFRMPLSGERIRRRFLKSDKIEILYGYIDSLQDSGKCKFEGVADYTDKY